MPSYKHPPRRHEPYKWTMSESLQVTLAYIKPNAASPSHQGISCRHRGPNQPLLLGSLEDLCISNPLRCGLLLYAAVICQLFMTRPTWHQSVLIHRDLPSTQLCICTTMVRVVGFLTGRNPSLAQHALYVSLTPPLLPYPDHFLGGSRTLGKHVIY